MNTDSAGSADISQASHTSLRLVSLVLSQIFLFLFLFLGLSKAEARKVGPVVWCGEGCGGVAREVVGFVVISWYT